MKQEQESNIEKWFYEKTNEFFICGLLYKKENLPHFTDELYQFVYNQFFILDIFKSSHNKVGIKQVYDTLTYVIRMKKMGLNNRVIVLLLNN
jgi:ATP-dependent RNA circularization protein (DNA/RNA ligase family)